MTIKFYSITVKRNVLNKTLGTATDLTGTLRDPCSLIDPDILIESATVPAFNYAQISDFGRYYFITSITAESYNMYRIRMHEDVLMSWKGTKETTLGADDATGIYGLHAYITRAADRDTTVVDTIFPVEGDPIVTKKTATLITGSPAWYGSSDLDATHIIGETEYRFIFSFQGQGRDQANNIVSQYWPITTVAMARAEFTEFMATISDEYMTGNGDSLSKYIYDVYALPTKVTVDSTRVTKLDPPGGLNQIVLPNLPYQVPHPIEMFVPTKLAPIDVTWSFNLSENTALVYQNFAPYRRYSLLFLPWGKLDLDPSLVYHGTSNPKLYIRASVDPLSGNAALYYGKTSSTTYHYLGSTNVKISFPVSSASYNATKVVAGVITTVASIASMVATEGATAPAVLGASAGALTAMSGAATPNASITGGQQIIIDDAPTLLVTEYVPNQGYDDDLFGLPDCTTRLVSRVSGYMEVGRVQIGGTGFSGILEDERKELETILKGGIIV